MKKLKGMVNVLDKRSHIQPEIYGHFSEHLGKCIYEGIFVGKNSDIPNTNGIRNDVVEAFKNIKMPVLRWPGGCFADEYHWRDGIGPMQERKKMINTHWGGVTEDNSFGTHEFFDLCEQIGCEPYIAGNMGSGSVRELAEWIEYITFDGVSPMADLRRKNGREKPWRLKYLGIGNENWGCGGNMRPEFYADTYRRYATYCRNFSGNVLFKIACGPSVDDYDWTDKLLKVISNCQARAISLHYYTLPTGEWEHKGSATEFSKEEYYDTIRRTFFMDTLIEKHKGIIRRYNDCMKLVVDEWGCWYDVEPGTNPGFLYQQNTMRDAIVAACNLNLFNSHSDIVCMANLAQAVNVLQALLLTDGGRMIKTPTYHVFDLFKTHQDSDLVYSFIEPHYVQGIPAISHSASVDGDGNLTLTLANCSLDEDFELDITLQEMEGAKYTARMLTDEVHAHNTFEDENRVHIQEGILEKSAQGLRVQLPKCSVLQVRGIVK